MGLRASDFKNYKRQARAAGVEQGEQAARYCEVSEYDFEDAGYPDTVSFDGLSSDDAAQILSYAASEAEINSRQYADHPTIELARVTHDDFDQSTELWEEYEAGVEAGIESGVLKRLGFMSTTPNPPPPKIRDLHFAGYDFTSSPQGTHIQRGKVDLQRPGDYGADPVGDGRFRMVPSGDIVDYAERTKRLSRNGGQRRNATRSPIVEAMARAFFVSAWADAMEELCPDEARWSGMDLMVVAPETSPEAMEHAEWYAKTFEQANGGRSTQRLYDTARVTAERGGEGRLDEGTFGHYVAMEALGHGVSLSDDFPEAHEGLQIPYTEFSDVVLDCAPEGTYVDNARANARGGDVDGPAVTELVMWIENDATLSPDSGHGQGREIVKNLMRKRNKGTYDREKSVKLWEHLAESGAKSYAKEVGDSRPWHAQFSPATRRAAARELAESFHNAADAGEYDHVDVGFRRNRLSR